MWPPADPSLPAITLLVCEYATFHEDETLSVVRGGIGWTPLASVPAQVVLTLRLVIPPGILFPGEHELFAQSDDRVGRHYLDVAGERDDLGCQPAAAWNHSARRDDRRVRRRSRRGCVCGSVGPSYRDVPGNQAMSAAPLEIASARASVVRARGMGSRVEIRGSVATRGGGGTPSGGRLRLVQSEADAKRARGDRVVRARTSMPIPGPPRPYRIRPADLGRFLVGDVDDIAQMLETLEGAEFR